ncbi:MAG: trypsin-like serine peptidase [Albidovulum sp.]
MRGLLAILGLLVAAVPVLAEAPLKRLTLRQDILGWEAVGRVEMGDKGYCTGVLIAPDLVLTAAHCLYGGGEAYIRPDTMRFRAGLSDGVALAESAVARMVVHPGYEPNAPDAGRMIRYDLGLIELATPVPLTTAAPFAVAGLAPGARDLSVVSYGRGRDDALSWDDACRVQAHARGLIAFDCDVTFGSSGAPVFQRMGNRAAIVSLVSMGGKVDDGTLAFGMELPQAVSELKAALRRGAGAAPGQSKAPATTARTRMGGGAKFISP